MLAATLALLLAAQPQSAQAPALPEILVTAPRQTDAAAVERYVRGISSTTGGQLARFRDPVCPAAFGLPQEYSARIVGRIRAVAARAGMKVADEGCTPNVTIIIANNGPRAVQEMQRRSPRLFNGLAPGEYARLTRGEDPVRMWSLAEVRGQDGGPSQPAEGDETNPGGGGPAVRVTGSSIINLPTERVNTQSIVIIEEQATVGKTLTQLADYVAVRAIAGARTGGGLGQGNSILGLFGPDSQPPQSLTSLDLAYLRALDQTPGNQRATSHIARLSRVIASDLSSQSPR